VQNRSRRARGWDRRPGPQARAATDLIRTGGQYTVQSYPQQVMALLTHHPESVYSHSVPVHRVQVGQVWKKDDSGDTFLITKIYSEALTTFAVLRKTGSEEDPPIRIKILKSGASAILPGFTYTQESDEF
jgi:hypothetical protein